MSLRASVEEQGPAATTLQVFHRRLKIPVNVYLETVQGFLNPWDERAMQSFVEGYLQEQADPGIVGMVREERESDYVYLDAAIRYPQPAELN